MASAADLKNCRCATCIACSCKEHRCDTKAARRQQQRPALHYAPEDMISATAAAFRPPTCEQLAAASVCAARPRWAEITRPNDPSRKFQGDTTSQSTYRGAQNPRPPSAGPNGRPFFDRGEDADKGRESLPFEARTAYSEQYAAPRGDGPARQTVPSDRHLQTHFEVHPRGAKFEGETTNSREFQPYDLSRVQPQNSFTPAPSGSPHPKLRFEGESQTRADFGAKTRDPSQPIGHRHPEAQGYVPNNTRFEGHTTMQDTYRGQQPPPSRPTTAASPIGVPRQPIPFEGQSVTHADYPRYSPQAVRSPATKDAHRSAFANPRELYGGDQRGNDCHHYETETSRQFQAKRIPVPEPCPADAWASKAPTPTGSRTPNYRY